MKGADLTGEQLALAEGKAGQGKAGQTKGVQAKQSRSKAAQAERHRKLVESSGKLLLLDKLLPKLHADGRKVHYKKHILSGLSLCKPDSRHRVDLSYLNCSTM